MTYKLSDVMYELGKHWVLRVKSGFEVYKTGVTHSTRCAQIGYTGDVGLGKAVTECERREQRLYELISINDKTGKITIMTAHPATHSECCTMKSKLTVHKFRTIQLREVRA